MTTQEEMSAVARMLLSIYDTDIERIASREAASRHYIDPEDVAQAVRLSIVEEWKIYQGREADQVIAILRRRARRYIEKEVADYMYFSGAYLYTPQQVRYHLETSAWTEMTEHSDINARADVLAAWETLPPATKRAVYRRYALGIPTSEMTDAESRACRRGVDQITERMNKNVPPAVSTEEVLAHD